MAFRKKPKKPQACSENPGKEAEAKASLWMQISEWMRNCLAVLMSYCGDDESSELLEDQAFLTDLPHSHGASIHPPSFL